MYQQLSIAKIFFYILSLKPYYDIYKFKQHSFLSIPYIWLWEYMCLCQLVLKLSQEDPFSSVAKWWRKFPSYMVVNRVETDHLYKNRDDHTQRPYVLYFNCFYYNHACCLCLNFSNAVILCVCKYKVYIVKPNKLFWFWVRLSATWWIARRLISDN